MNCLGTYPKWSVGNDVRSILLADSGITGMVGTDIYPLIAPENTQGDFILYSRERYSVRNVKMGIYEESCQLALNIVSDNYDNAIILAEMVNDALLGNHQLNGNPITIELEDSTESYTDNKYLETLLFTIK
jgi:hypothetical protein